MVWVSDRIFLPRLLGLGLFAVGAWAVADQVRVSAETRTHLSAVAADAGSARRVLVQTLNELMSDLWMAARTPLVGKTRADRTHLAQQYFRIKIQENPLVSQLSYFDSGGKEEIRISRSHDQLKTPPTQGLQPPSDYPVQAALALRPEFVYASPLGLQREAGAIRLPLRPIIQLATRTAMNPEEPAGALIGSFDAAAMLTRFSGDEGEASGHRMLANGAGYWLAGKPAHQLWGVVFKRGPRASMATDNKPLWEAVRAAPSGTLVTPEAVYGFTTIRLSEVLGPRNSRHRPIVSDEVWYVISERTLRPWLTWSNELSGAAFLLALVVLVIGWLWSRIVAERALAAQQAARAREELERSERLASLGGLVAGVAHELSTPIGNAVTLASSLAGDADRISREIHAGTLKKSSILQLVEATTMGTSFLLRNLERAGELLGKFKAVAVDQSSEQRRPFHLDRYLEELVTTLQPQFKHTAVALSLDAESNLQLDSYPGPLGQVIINLATNALIHGFQRKSQGTVRIVCRAAAADMATLVVEDDGDGIAKTNLDRIFDPFFSTRIGEGGSGLGLSITKNIVDTLLGGEIEVSTREGEFTRFTLTLPVVSPAADQRRKDHHHVERAYA